MTTLLDIDFSTLANQNLNADGNFNVGGFTWKKENTAHEVSATQVVNGTGLQFSPDGASNYNGGARTCPLLWLPFANIPLAAGISWDTKIRVGVEITSDFALGLSDMIAGFDSDSGVYGCTLLRGATSGATSGIGARQITNSGPTFNAVNLGVMDGTTHAVVMSCNALAAATERVSVYTAANLGVAFGSMKPQVGVNVSPGANLNTADVGGVGVLNALGIVVGAYRSGGGAFTGTFKRLKVDICV